LIDIVQRCQRAEPRQLSQRNRRVSWA